MIKPFLMLAGTEGHVLYAALFYLFALTAVGSAVGVVVFRNIVRAAVSLLFTLASVGGLYFLLNAEFLAAVQLVVYTGGILILMIFGVMLTSTSPFSRFHPNRREIFASLLVGGVLLLVLLLVVVRTAFRHALVIAPVEGIESLGQALLGEYVVPFEMASVMLLIVMVGAAYVAKDRRASHLPKVG